MDPVRAALAAAGGVLRRRDLLALGRTDRQIVASLGRGSIVRARQGWYALPGLPEPAMTGLRAGGLLTGTAALESYGVWVPRRERAVVQFAHNAARFSTRVARSGVAVRWGAAAHPVPAADRSCWRVEPLTALAQALGHCDRDTAVVLADSILNLELASRDDLGAVFRAGGSAAASWFELVDGRADAGGETYARLWLADAGVRAEPQFSVPGAGHFDLRASRTVLLEVDGRAHHDGEDAFLRDREKDLRAALWGYTVLRIGYRQLQHDWPTCLAAVQRLIREQGS